LAVNTAEAWQNLSWKIVQQVPKTGLVEQSFSEKNKRICRELNSPTGEIFRKRS
jgi:hypothetical protein